MMCNILLSLLLIILPLLIKSVEFFSRTPSPTLYPTDSTVENPCRINSCAECTQEYNCVWCGDRCIIDSEICYDNDNLITQEFGMCTLYLLIWFKINKWILWINSMSWLFTNSKCIF